MTVLETIDKRTEIPKEVILNVVEQIKAKFQPNKIILFGSYAYGNPRPESDVDLLIVMPTKLKPSQQAIKIMRDIEFHFGLELVVKTPDDLKKRLKLGDFFLKEVVEKGVILYESNS